MVTKPELYWEKQLKEYFKSRHLPLWGVILVDLLTAWVAYFIALFLRYNFNFSITFSIDTLYEVLLVMVTYFGSFFIFKTYIGAFRYTGVKDLLRLFYASLVASGLIYLISHWTAFGEENYRQQLTIALIIQHGMNFFLMSVGMRLLVRLVYSRYAKGQRYQRTKGILIYGAGVTGITVRNAIKQDTLSHREVVAYVDDNEKLQGKSIDGIPVLSPEKAFKAEFIDDHYVEEVIWSVQSIDGDRFAEVAEICLSYRLEFNRVPKIQEWIGGNISRSQLKKVKIEDLLNRAEINLENEGLRNFIQGKVVMVTGAAGSIGSELCRQIVYYRPKLLVMVDAAETAMHDMELELKKHLHFMDNVKFVIGDVTRENRMEEIFRTYQPENVFHAAAYKHVPMMEANPKEAVKVNMCGTLTVAKLAVAHGVEKFVFVSTDKAVNPTNVMGATKRGAEMMVQMMAAKGKTKFITTRFGNVLGSNGSVIPLFRKQLENREALTVTHKDVVRYFMTIPEACQLVFQAATMGNGGEIFVFDMGEPVRIYDLAEKMIKLSGLIPGKDIEIRETGLRPGEKLYEELLSDKENTLETPHPKILVAKVRAVDEETECALIREMCDVVSGDVSDVELVKRLKRLVPEYKSENSVYAELDEPVKML